MVDYGERFRAGKRISSEFAARAINQAISKRQPIRWTKRDAHLALQTRTRMLNGN